MLRCYLRLAALLLVILILSGCLATSEESLDQPGDLPAMVQVAETAPSAPIEPSATPSPVVMADASFDCHNVEEIPAAECEALIAIYEATGGPQWSDSTGWLATNAPCSWLGVSCAGGQVDTLDLYFNGLSGQLPAALADLPALRVLDLHNNQVSGAIPAEFTRLASLEYLDLSANKLNGNIPADLGALTKLQTLNLAKNLLSGPIPAELEQLASLRNFDLSHNTFTGTIPESLANLSALEALELGDNMLDEGIPFSLGQLPALYLIDLSFNQLTGSAPSAVFEIPNHQLWGNQLEGTIFSNGGQQNVNYLGASFTFDPSTANSVWPELVAAGSIEPGPGPAWDPPEHIVFTLAGDQPKDHNPMGLYVPPEAQIQIYPTENLNVEVRPVVEALEQILADRPDLSAYEITAAGMGIDDPPLRLLPPSNAQQVLRSQAEYVDFIGGSGVRYLTMLSQGLVPVSNQDLFYTFQGRTDDGATYVAVYYPVSLPDLPDSPQLDEADLNALAEDWAGYLNDSLAVLNRQTGAAFIPDLAAIDALINTLSVAGITPPPTIEGGGIAPNDGDTVGKQPVLQWVEVPGAVGYEVTVLDDAAFPPQVIIGETVTEPNLAVEAPLDPGHYSWTVRAVGEDGTVLAELNRTFIVETAVPVTGDAPTISLNTGSIASGYSTETIEAMPDGSDASFWHLLPEYTVATLRGYPISNHLMQPQIFVYPAQELQEVNESAAQIVASLQSLIESPLEIPNMPFLPFFNANQVMHAQVQYLDFTNGQGLRYITEYDQAFIPINNYELIYTYQGLTSDGKYYVAAVLPITHSSLPAEANVTGNEPPEFTSDFPSYLATTTGFLNAQASNTYMPDLTQLDAMMSSLEISQTEH